MNGLFKKIALLTTGLVIGVVVGRKGYFLKRKFIDVDVSQYF